jgi:hypothetical protein
MRNTAPVLIVLALVFCLAGCGAKPAPEKLAMKGKNVVCILSGDKRFKTEVIEKVARSLEAKGFSVVRDETGNAEYYNAADYGAVVYIAEYQAWHTPRHAIGYFKRNGQAPNIVFVITAGNPHLKIKKPFDAVTSASKQKEVDRVSGEIMTRLDGILK